jgi:sulfide:quinone oxidoreductase
MPHLFHRVPFTSSRRASAAPWILGAILAAAAAATASEAGSVQSIVGFHPLSDRVAIGTQPTADQVTALAAAGFNGIVNLREESEFNDGPQSHAAVTSGMQFFRVPLSKEEPSDAAVEKFLAVTDEPTVYPLFIYCASGNRAAAVWMIRRVLRDGWALADAEAEAQQAGLTSEKMRDFARDYVRRHAKG